MSDDEPKVKNQTVTQNTSPWGPQQAPLTQSFADATKLYDSGGLNYGYYPGQTVAGLAPESTMAWDKISQRAQAGSPTLQGANQYVQGILSGNDTGLLDPAIDRIRSGVNANYSAAGRYGSGAHDAAVTDRVGGLIFDRMGQAAQMAPQLAQQDYFDAQQLANVGSARQAHAQDQISAEIARYNALQSAPADAIARYQALVGGGYGTNTQGTQPIQLSGGSNPWLQSGAVGASLLGSALQGGLFS